MRNIVAAAEITYIVDLVEYLLRYLAEGARGRHAADVGAGAYEGTLQAVADVVAELVACDTYAQAAVLGNKAGRNTLGTVQNDGNGLICTVKDIPCNIRYVAEIALDAVGVVYETQHGLAVPALLYLVYALYCLLVGGIAAYSPYCIRRIDDYPTLLKAVYCILDVNVAIHSEFAGKMEIKVFEILLGHTEDVAAVGKEDVTSVTVLGHILVLAFLEILQFLLVSRLA